jgi:hypothetical protein
MPKLFLDLLVGPWAPAYFPPLVALAVNTFYWGFVAHYDITNLLEVFWKSLELECAREIEKTVEVHIGTLKHNGKQTRSLICIPTNREIKKATGLFSQGLVDIPEF